MEKDSKLRSKPIMRGWMMSLLWQLEVSRSERDFIRIIYPDHLKARVMTLMSSGIYQKWDENERAKFSDGPKFLYVEEAGTIF